MERRATMGTQSIMKFSVIQENLLAKEICKKYEKQMHDNYEIERGEWKADFSRKTVHWLHYHSLNILKK